MILLGIANLPITPTKHSHVCCCTHQHASISNRLNSRVQKHGRRTIRIKINLQQHNQERVYISITLNNVINIDRGKTINNHSFQLGLQYTLKKPTGFMLWALCFHGAKPFPLSFFSATDVKQMCLRNWLDYTCKYSVLILANAYHIKFFGMGKHIYTSICKMWLHLWTCHWTIELYISPASFNWSCKASKRVSIILREIVNELITELEPQSDILYSVILCKNVLILS